MSGAFPVTNFGGTKSKGQKQMSESAVASRRRFERFTMHFPAMFSWMNERGERQVAHGITRDVAMTGAYVSAAECPPILSEVYVEIRVPKLSSRGSIFRLSAVGEVCRSEMSEAISGFAVNATRKFDLTRLSESMQAEASITQK